MSERRDRKSASEQERTRPRENHDNDIRLRLMKKEEDRVALALNSAKMVAVLSGMEIMYVFMHQNQYLSFIHKMDAEDGRFKAWPVNERNTAMFKNLASVADRLFEVTPKQGMDPMGVMVAAERGIINYLDATGQLPAEDTDFMSWKDAPKEGEQ